MHVCVCVCVLLGQNSGLEAPRSGPGASSGSPVDLDPHLASCSSPSRLSIESSKQHDSSLFT